MSEKRHDNKPKAGEDFRADLDAGLLEANQVDGYDIESPNARPGAQDPKTDGAVRDATYRDGSKGTYGQGKPKKH